jgi:hypothetical protein
MDRDPLNFFQPFENLRPGHENQLTRALLLVLRLCPIAHEAWLSRLTGSKHLWELTDATFVTQRRQILMQEDPEDLLPLISVFLTPEGSFDDSVVMAESDRRQVLDAIVTYPGEQVVVVENKIAPAENWQAANINISGVAVKIAEGQTPVHVRWPDLLGDFTHLLEHRRVDGAESTILSDFLVYIEDHFPGLGPDRTLRMCAGNEFRTGRRLRSLLHESLGLEARIDGWGPCVSVEHLNGIADRMYLLPWGNPAQPEEDMIALVIDPADTITQARALYPKPALIDGIRELLEQPRWSGKQNFHFGHMQPGLVWTSGDIEIGDYLDLWVENADDIGSIRRNEWDKWFDWLVQKHVAKPEDREEFDRHFTNTGRQNALVRPGFEIARWWPLAEAQTLDDAGQLAIGIKAAYAEITTRLS